MMRHFDCYQNTFSRKPELCDAQKLMELFSDSSSNATLAQYRSLTAEQEDERKALKSKLHCVCFHSHCEGRRSAKNAIPSMLAMLDLDHVTDREALMSHLRSLADDGELSTLCKQQGFALVYTTPSYGLRIVGDMCKLGCKTISEWQHKVAKALKLDELAAKGILEVDYVCKDLVRLSYVTSKEDILYLDLDLMFSEPEYVSFEDKYDDNHNDNSFAADNDVDVDADATNDQRLTTNGPTPNSDPAPSEFTYNGFTLREMAEKWISVTGAPIRGERHKMYLELVGLFKDLCERNKEVLLAQIPDFGKPIDERRRIIDDVLNRQKSAVIPNDFLHFLEDYGYKPRKVSYDDQRLERNLEQMNESSRQRRKEQQAELDAELSHLPSKKDTGKFPSVYSTYKRIMPLHLVKPSVLMLDAVMGTYFANIGARYLDGTMERPIFHNLVVGAPNCGKGALAKQRDWLLRALKAQDAEMLALEAEYREAERRAKNAKEQPVKPDLHFRLMESTFSNTSLLDRQETSHGLTQLVSVTEIDSLFKNGGHAKYDDMWRNQYHMEEVSQYYKSTQSWAGRIKLMINVFATGTPGQFLTHYGNPENGLCTRINFWNITERFIDDFVVKPMTAMEEAYINKVIAFAMELTYGRDENDGLIFKPMRDISADMEFMLPVCRDFNRKQLALARETMDGGRDTFRKRVALDMFRGAMVDWGCALGKLDKKRKKDIIDFRWAKAEEQLELKLSYYGDKLEEQERAETVKKPRFNNIFEALDKEFTMDDLNAAKGNNRTPVKRIICYWVKAGLIKKSDDYSNSDTIYTKLKTTNYKTLTNR